MRLVPRAALALAAAIPLTLASARAEDPPSAPRGAPQAAAPAKKKGGARRSATRAVPASGAAQAPRTPAGANIPAMEALPWSSPPGGYDGGDESVEVLRTGRCGG